MVASYCPLTDRGLLRQRYGVTTDPSSQWPEDVSPELPAPIICKAHDGPARLLLSARFGLLPHWVRDPTVARKTFNARLETLTEKAIFKDTWEKGQRCLVPAMAFHAPSGPGEGHTRWRWQPQDEPVVTLAGLWARGWSPSGEALLTFTLLTTASEGPDPEGLRLPVALPNEALDAWLQAPPDEAMALVRQCAPIGWTQAKEEVPERLLPKRIKNTPKDLPFRSRALPP
jgi:putative SOS response-associated peptidase YedK